MLDAAEKATRCVVGTKLHVLYTKTSGFNTTALTCTEKKQFCVSIRFKAAHKILRHKNFLKGKDLGFLII